MHALRHFCHLCRVERQLDGSRSAVEALQGALVTAADKRGLRAWFRGVRRLTLRSRQGIGGVSLQT